MSYSTVSIGYIRDDGDFHILATLNNNDEIYSAECFSKLVEKVKEFLSIFTDDNPYSSRDVIILERQDTPDYVDLEEYELPEGYVMDEIGRITKTNPKGTPYALKGAVHRNLFRYLKSLFNNLQK